MSAIETFSFGRYTLRPAGRLSIDILLATQWTEADPDHAGRVAPDFWLEQRLGRDSYVLDDQDGPLFFFKAVHCHPRVEIHVQFPPRFNAIRFPGEAALQRHVLSRAMIEGLRWLERVLTQNDIREIYFDSANDPLIAFCTKRLGFNRDGSKLLKRLGVTHFSGMAMERNS